MNIQSLLGFGVVTLVTSCTSGPKGLAERKATPPRPSVDDGNPLPAGHDTLKLVAGQDSKRGVGSCELVRILDGGGGVFRVTSMSTRVEGDIRSGANGAFTYVELRLIERWVDGAPDRVIARVEGGDLPNGESSSSPVSMALGDVIGVLMYAPRPENRGYAQLDSLGVFAPDGLGGYSNGQLFRGERMSLSDIWAALSSNADGVCRHNIEPRPSRPSQAPVDEGPIRPALENAEIHQETDPD